MRVDFRQSIRILLIFISTEVSFSLCGQERYVFVTPKIDSICQSTLDLIRIRQSLILQQYAVDNDVEQIRYTIGVMNQQLEEAMNERMAIETEMAAINRLIDSITPKRPDGPRPRENIIDFLNERLSFHGKYGLNINQLALSNWAAGGENSSTGKAFADFILVYHNKLSEQKLTGSFAFGIARFADNHIEKSDDKIDLTYSISPNSKKQWNFSMVSTFNTQFAEGYKYPNDSTMLSCFFAPAYLTLSGGYTFKSKDERFQIYMSPMAGKITFVMNQKLADKGSYGVRSGYYDAEGLWNPGEHVAAALGINVIINYKQPIGGNITYTTILNTFYNYVETRNGARLPLDINWENTFNLAINKYITAIFFIHMKYDHNTTFPVYETIGGQETVVDNVPKLQIKESLGIAFVHNF